MYCKECKKETEIGHYCGYCGRDIQHDMDKKDYCHACNVSLYKRDYTNCPYCGSPLDVRPKTEFAQKLENILGKDENNTWEKSREELRELQDTAQDIIDGMKFIAEIFE